MPCPFFRLFSSLSLSSSHPHTHPPFPSSPSPKTGKITALPQHYNTMPSSSVTAAAPGSRLLPWANMGAYILNIAATYVIGTTGTIGKTNSEGNYYVFPLSHV